MNNLFSSIEKKDANSHLLDDAEDGGLQDISDIVKFYHDTKIWVEVDNNYGLVLLDGTPVKIPGVTEVIFDIKGKVYKFKTASGTYMPYFAESSINQDQYYITGYYTQQEVNRFAGMPADSNEKKDSLRILRFDGFGNITSSDTLFSKFPKIEFGVYGDCYCEQRWEADTTVNAGMYINDNSSNWFFPKMIKYSISQKGDVEYSDCSGNCFDYSSFNVEGPAEVLIPQLSQHFSSLQDIIDIVEFIHSKIPENNTFVFYNSESTNDLERYFSTFITDKIPTDDVTLAIYLIENQINTLAKFKTAFGENTSSSASDVDVIFSKTDLWSGINKQTYNQYSIDHVIAKETGNNIPYEYCYKDLVYRDKYRIKGGVIFTGIQKLENSGHAESIYLEASYDQYVAQFGTNSAFYSLLGSFTETMGPVFLAYGGRQIVNILGPEIFASGNNALSNIFRNNIKNYIKTYVSIRAREAIITGIKSYVAYMIIDATLRVICDLSPDFQTAFMEVNQGAAMLQGVTDGVATYVDLPDVEIASFLAISNCIIGTVETSEQSAQVQEQSCLFSALVSVIVSSGGNIKTILVKRILALTTAAKNTLKSKLSGTIASDHWIWSEVFGMADNVMSILKNKLKSAGIPNNIVNSIDSWDNSTVQKLNELLDDPNYSGLIDELANNTNLLNYFKMCEETWWAKFALRKLSFTGQLPPKFASFIDNIRVTYQGQTVSLSNALLGNQGSMPLGKVFDEEMERLVVKFWNQGINEGLSSAVINKLTQLKNAGYELVVKPSVSAGGKSPEPDLLFIKKTSFGLNFNDCVYIDNKYFHDVGFTPPQNEIVKQFDGVSTESVVTTNQLMTVNGVDINMGTVLKIKEIGIFTVDELLNMASILKKP